MIPPYFAKKNKIAAKIFLPYHPIIQGVMAIALFSPKYRVAFSFSIV
jgi:hypothetical protein